MVRPTTVAQTIVVAQTMCPFPALGQTDGIWMAHNFQKSCTKRCIFGSSIFFWKFQRISWASFLEVSEGRKNLRGSHTRDSTLTI